MMVDELIKNIRVNANGRKLLSSQEKAYLAGAAQRSAARLKNGKLLAYLVLNFVEDMDLSPANFINGRRAMAYGC